MGLILQRYLIYSYAYYILNKSLVSDEEYDSMAKTLLENWNTFEHRHKHLITEDDLRAGTLYAVKAEAYPLIVQHTAKMLIKERGL